LETSLKSFGFFIDVSIIIHLQCQMTRFLGRKLECNVMVWKKNIA